MFCTIDSLSDWWSGWFGGVTVTGSDSLKMFGSSLTMYFAVLGTFSRVCHLRYVFVAGLLSLHVSAG